MASEAAIVRAALRDVPAPFQPKLAIAGASSARAAEGARRLVIEGVEALLSFGLAGGLDPALDTGDGVLARAVVLPDGTRIETDAAWRARLGDALAANGRVALGDVAGADAALATPAEKARLYRATGAIAVDMESHAVAAAARAAGVPFMVLRAILDTASDAIPEAALAGLDASGNAHALPVLARAILRPWEFPALIRLGRANRAALASLGRLAADLGPAFVFGP